ncbi:MAG: hypothetical protein ACK5PB_18965 [Pirellula sp.]|jgi:hypothetical protein
MRWTITEGTVLQNGENGSLRIVNLNGKVLALDKCGADWLEKLMTDHEQFLKLPGASEFANSLQSAGVVVRQSMGYRITNLIRHAACQFLIATILPLCSILPGVELRIRWMMIAVKLLIYGLGWKTVVDSIVACRHWLALFPGLSNRKPHDELESLLMNAASRCVIGAACKERAILFFLLNLKLWPMVKIIVAFQWTPLGGHSWCEIAGAAFTDPDNLRLQGFERICTLP